MIGQLRQVRNRGAVAALAAVALVLSACGSSSTPTTQSSTTGSASGSSGASSGGAAAPTGTLVIDSSFDLKTIDPAREYELTGQMVTKGLYDTLLTFANNDLTKPVPDLASAYNLSADGKTLTLTLASGRVFSDGSPVTADDVIFSLQRVIGIKGNPSFLLDGVKVTKKDAKTVVLTSATPNAALPYILPNPSLSILNSKVVKANGGTTDAKDAAEKYLNGASAGSGPLMLKTMDVSSKVTLVANPKYNGSTKPGYGTVVIRNVKAATQKLNVQKGDSQVALDLSGDQVTGLASDKLTVASGASAFTIFLLLNQGAQVSKATSNPKYVAAVKKAIDYQGLLSVAGKGSVQPAGIIPSMLAGTLPSDKAMKFDLAGAKADLAASGVASEKVKLSYPSDISLGGLSFQTLAEKLQSQLNAAGITVDLAPAPVATELDAYRGGKEQIGLWYWGPDFPDPSNYLAFAPGNLIGKRTNWPASAAPDIDAAAKKAAAASDPAQRTTLFQQFQSDLNASGPFIPLVQPPTNIVSASSVTNATYNPIWTVDVGTIGSK
jgi:peptide/nickel transport system substrate-binding protein